MQNKRKHNNQLYTPVKINMEPKKQPIEKETHLPNLHFRVPCEFSGVYM